MSNHIYSLLLKMYSSLDKRAILPVFLILIGCGLAFNLSEKKSSSTGYESKNSILCSNDCDYIYIKTKKENFSLTKKANGWRVDCRSFLAKEHLVKKLFYQLKSLPISQRIDLDEPNLFKVGLSATQPNDNTVSISLHKAGEEIGLVILGDVIDPKIGDNAEKQHLMGAGKHSYRAIAVKKGKGVLQAFYIPVNALEIEMSPIGWLSEVVVPHSSKVVSVSVSLPDGRKRIFSRKRVLGSFKDESLGLKMPDEYTIKLANILNPGFGKLYDVAASVDLVENPNDKTIITIVTLDKIKYTIHLFDSAYYTKKFANVAAKKSPVVQIVQEVARPKKYGLATYTLSSIDGSNKMMDAINEDNKGFAFVVGMNEINEIVEYLN